MGRALDREHGGRRPDRPGEAGGEFLDVDAAATDDRAPLRSVADAEQTVVLEEAEQAPCRKGAERVRIRRPHRGAQREEVEFDELTPEDRKRIDLIVRSLRAEGAFF